MVQLHPIWILAKRKCDKAPRVLAVHSLKKKMMIMTMLAVWEPKEWLLKRKVAMMRRI